MEREELAPILAKVYTMIRTHLEMTTTLTQCTQALLEALKAQDPSFGATYADAFERLTSGESGKQYAQALAQIDLVIERIKAGQF